MSTSIDFATSQHKQGYDAQVAWLTGKIVTEAQTALDLRTGSIDHSHPFNRGGTEAIRDYIATHATAP